jgi:hypothetical protein
MNYPPGPYAPQGYPPPHGYGYPPPGPKRSAIPKVIGILMIIFGSFAVLGGLMNLAGAGGMGDLNNNPAFRSGDSDMDTIKAAVDRLESFNRISGLIGLAMGLFELFTGIAAVKYKRNAPKMAVTFGAVNIAQVVLTMVLFYAWLSPVLDKAPSMVKSMVGLGFFIGAVFGCAWPIIILALMTRPKAKEACVN